MKETKSKPMQKSIAIVVHACDRYELLFQGFEYFFKKYWPMDTIIGNYYFLTEETDYKSNIFTNIKTGKGEWTQRLHTALQKIDEEYIIYMQEDMWFSEILSADTINGIVKFALDEKLQLMKLNSSEVYKTTATDTVITGLRVGVLDNEASNYLMSHQVSIWNKELLMSQLIYNEHPWRNERKGTKRLKKLNPVIYHIDLFSENGKLPINNNLSTACSGSYVTVSVNSVLNDFVVPFINELKRSKEQVYNDYAQKLAYHYNNKYTHDGKPKPRKTWF